MNQPTTPSPTVQTSAALPQSPHRPLDPRTIAQALAAVRADSQRQPETYLRDTVVPHGGE